MEINLELLGLEDLNAKLALIDEKLTGRGLAPILEEAGKAMQAAVSDAAPRDSGLLASDIDLKIGVKDTSASAYIGVGYPEMYPESEK